MLKAAAFKADSRDPRRHLLDAAVLLACLDDPFAAREQYTGSDLGRMLLLGRHLPDEAREWRLLGREHAAQGRDALRILTAGLA